MKSKRNILFVATVLAFVVTAPIVTLYTAGYRYQWKKQHFERVGFFETGSVPASATVKIDGETVGTTPYVDVGILPGNYLLSLGKPGYREYNTTFEVRSGISTLLLNILLWKDSIPELVSKTQANAVLDPNGTALAWVDPVKPAAYLSLSNGEKTKQVCAFSKRTSPETARIFWNASGNSALFTHRTNRGIDGCIASLDGNSYQFSELIGEPIRAVEWSPFDDSHILVQTESSGLVVAFERKERKIVTQKPLPFTIRGSKLYGVRSTALGMELFNQPLGTLPILFGPSTVALPTGEYSFLPSPEKYLVLREARHGRVDVFEASSFQRLATLVAESIIFEPGFRSDRFLALNDHELSLYDLKEETSRLIIRYSVPINKVIWHPLRSHAIVEAGGNIIALPFERSSEEAVTLAPIHDVQSLWIDKRADTLLMVGTHEATTGVWKLELKD